MTKQKKALGLSSFLFCLLVISRGCVAQEAESLQGFKNQVSTNLVLPLFDSFDVNYERTLNNKWAMGIAGALYGSSASELITVTSSYYEYKTNWEIMPFGRVYFQGAQNKSHFVELFGSLSETEETGRVVRSTNEEGLGVYAIRTKTYAVGGLGAGYGYRFLLLEDKLVLEAQFGIRTNFDIDFILLNGALVRTGIKVGYRF